MDSKNKRITKKRGRPATGQDPIRHIRMADPLANEVNKWARKQPDRPTFSEAVRRLVMKALGLQ
jgi:hypothetical protein